MQPQRQYVGIDLHRRRSVIVRMTPEGEKLDVVRIENDPVALSLEVAKAGPDPDVVLEACYGWYWAADVLAECGGRVHLAPYPRFEGRENFMGLAVLAENWFWEPAWEPTEPGSVSAARTGMDS